MAWARTGFWYNTLEMRILFLSDIHGVPSTLEAAFESASSLGYDKIVLLGDLLYHGPRNGVPDFYDPVKVAQMLNLRKDKIIAVRGNCDAEVDQMMFEFPMMGDYEILDAGTEKFFLTHGHTHIPELKKLACGMTIFNPGSVSLPKGGTQRSFGYYDGKELKHYVI